MSTDSDQQQIIKKGEQWASEIQRKLSRLTAEKLLQMEEIAKDHISWFEQHDTAEKLLEAKKPYHFSNIKRADNGRNTNNDTKRTQSLTDRRRGSSSSDGSMRTASEMNDVDNQDTDRVHLVQASRHHITTAANNNNNMRMSSSFHRNSGSFILQPRSSYNSNNNNRISKSNATTTTTTTASAARTSTKKRVTMSASSSTVTTTASKESNGESDSDGMDSDLCPTNIPEWATSPELMEKLKFQKPTDGDKVFGEMVPMEISVIFGNTVKSKP